MTTKFTPRKCSLLLALICAAVWHSGSASAQPGNLDALFRSPPDTAKPWVYWWWIKGNVTEASITRDLEEMKRKGFAGFLLFDARGYHEGHLPPPPTRMDFMSPEWRRMVKFALVEAERVGLQASVNLSSCAGALRGPWEVGDDAPKKLVWAKSEIEPGKRPIEVPRGDWGRSRDVAILAVRHGEATAGKNAPPAVRDVVDLSDKLDAQGRLAWSPPAGNWSLFRFASQIIAGHENDVDILDAKAVERHFDRMGRALLADAGPLAGKTLTHFYSVSWEGATPTWTPGFEQEFQRRCGYGLRRWLPVLAGTTIQDRQNSERFLHDYYKTLAECFMDNCYGTLAELCHRSGLKWHSESGGPWDRKLPSFRHADQLAFLGRNDMPQGEFWYPARGFNRPVAMAAHTYGRPLAAAESFTHMRPHWSVYPALLKPLADAAFCDGVNQLIWHTFTASPPEFGKPGIEYFAGSHLNPNVTWWEYSGAFLNYLARCQLLLRQGRFVADVCCYTGDRTYLHWGRGEKWGEKSTLTLGNGCAYDLVNTEVLLERMSVRDKMLALPDGMRYRMLFVDLEDETAEPRALRKVLELAKAGATVLLGQRRPERAPGLTDYPACDAEVRRMAEELWGPPGGPPQPVAMGKGTVLRGTTGNGSLLSALGAIAALHTVDFPLDYEGPWDYIHRQDGETDIYFLSGVGSALCTFRVSGKEPELWDPRTGRIHDVVCYRPTDDGRTLLSITLPANGSIFVVFRKPADPKRLASVSDWESAEIAGRSKDAVVFDLWKNGQYRAGTPQGKSLTFEAAHLPDPLPLAGPWQVKFAPGWGAPESAVFDRLVPWNEHPDAGIRFFSGTGTYRKSFELSAAQAQGLVRLQLGEVKHLARVRVNGKPLGVVWTEPWSVDLTGVVKPGKNDLEIDVVNLWVNRLVGDASLPEEKRLTKTHARRLPTDQGPHAHLRGYTAKDPLVRSGLLGPVRLEFGVQVAKQLP